jgi:plasmid stabilization system protein ParE
VIFRVEYLPEARAELAAAADWFEQHTSLGGAGFADVIDRAIEQIRALPRAWPAWPLRPRFHVRPLRRIRFQIFFEILDDVVRIVAITHTSREPGHWLDRAK